ncbi:LCP family protein [Clostridium pasteurianum]|uniref:Cell envelope-related function transcriptional attenuator common domain protein n=1 Tax=Clostridium pasteurianum BC1 TaxID=86416 RepID=R4K3A2_CLOPA|nr:LCP family protein [Clostridium pasteurianum]AGK97053.1 cell envelope-related function transcriptional attenuator common domain protein [Clostridium pasteurianum BC1]
MDGENQGTKSKKILKVAVIAILAVIVCIGVGVTCFTVFYLSSTNSKSNLININASAPGKDEPVNILVAGVDTGSNDSGDSVKINTIKEANSIVLLHYDPKNENLKIISIPRDTMINLNEKRQKISVSNSVNGPKYLVSNVEELMNTKVNYYVQLDYNAFKDVINSLGGVDVNVNNKMDYDDNLQNLHINFDKGVTHLNGQKAEEYFRWVKNNDGKFIVGGDLGRIKNQQQLIDAVIKKFSRFSTVFKYPAIISSVSKDIVTNMTPNQIIKYARTFSHLKNQNISIATAKGLEVSIENNKYFLLDTANNSANLSTTKAVNKSDNINKSALKINIQNGTTKNGLAKNYQTKLSEKGFTNITTGNAPKKPVEATKITFYGIDENKLIQINNDMSGLIKTDNYELIPQKSSHDVVIVLGNDLGN